MKVLLFTQWEPDPWITRVVPPVVAKTFPRSWRVQLLAGKSPQESFVIEARDYALEMAADRWWLVECENAEAGRETISWCGYHQRTEFHVGGTLHGRILASGGRAA